MQRLGIEGRLVLAFTMAGGIIVTALLVSAASLAGTMSPAGLFTTTCVLFLAGSVVGWVHAVLLGYLGRTPGTSARAVTRHILQAGLWSVPPMFLAMLAAVGIALTRVVLRAGGVAAIPVAILSWLVGIGICIWAGECAVEAIRNLHARYPEVRRSLSVLPAVLILLVVLFERTHPQVWGTSYHVTTMGAAVLAVGATTWIATPIVFAVFHILRGRRPPHVH